MLNKIKGMLLQFAKPLLLSHLNDLDKLGPTLAKVLVEKSHATQEQADALAKDLLEVVKGELKLLVEKI